MSDVAALLMALDRPDGGGMEDVREATIVPLGRAIFPAALEVYPGMRHWMGRTGLVYTAMKFAMVDPDARRLGVMALGDRSKHVRYRAAMLLAVSGAPDTLPALEAALDHPSRETREDAAAAIAAIREGNPDLFLDRRRTGRVHLQIGGLVRPGAPQG